jgi:hypothetical protein
MPPAVKDTVSGVSLPKMDEMIYGSKPSASTNVSAPASKPAAESSQSNLEVYKEARKITDGWKTDKSNAKSQKDAIVAKLERIKGDDVYANGWIKNVMDAYAKTVAGRRRRRHTKKVRKAKRKHTHRRR